MSCFINTKLAADEDEEVQKRLPINPNSEDLFLKMSDGLLLIKFLNLIDENAVDLRSINKYGPGMSAMDVKINIQ